MHMSAGVCKVRFLQQFYGQWIMPVVVAIYCIVQFHGWQIICVLYLSGQLCMRFCWSGDVNQNSRHDLLKSRDTSKMKTKGLGIETVWGVLLCQCSIFLSSWGTSTCQICMVHILFWSWSGTKSISLIATARSHFFQICSCPAQYQFFSRYHAGRRICTNLARWKGQRP